MFPVGFLLQFDTKVLRFESVCIIINTIVLNSLIIWGWLFVTYGIDTEVLHFGIVPKPKLWYRAIPNLHDNIPSICRFLLWSLYSVTI